MDKNKEKLNKRVKRHKRVRAKISGTSARPRLSIFRSNKYVFLQLIDDQENKTLVSVSDNKLLDKKMTKTERAREAGKELAKTAKKKDIKQAVFDRGGFAFHGRVKAVVEEARKQGLKI